MQLIALKAQVDALIALEESEMGVVQTPPGECPHPEDAREDKTTLDGKRQFWCSRCMRMVEGIA